MRGNKVKAYTTIINSEKHNELTLLFVCIIYKRSIQQLPMKLELLCQKPSLSKIIYLNRPMSSYIIFWLSLVVTGG
jgi:hypothetical protein